MGAAVLSGPGNSVTMSAALLFAVSFSVRESDPTCGPGRYSLTQLVLAVSRSSPNVTRADFFVQLQTADFTTAEPTNLVGTVVVR